MSLRSKPRKRLIGYARVSTQQQDLARQIKALKRVGCSAIYSDTASGKSMTGRPELARALDDLVLTRADSVGDLARAFDLDPTALGTTIDRWNAACAAGRVPLAASA